MDKEQIFQFLNANPACHLATTEGTQPRVRGMMMIKADSKGLIFQTAAFKSLYKQVVENSKVEICFNSKDTQVRVAGTVQILDDLNLKKEIVESRPFLKPIVAKQGYEAIVVFRVIDCKVASWTMATNLEQTTYTKI